MTTLAELLVDRLDQDLARRRRELIDLRLILSISRGARLDLMARACVVVAYSHWEGFVKHAIREYFYHLNSMQVRVGDLRYEIQANAFRSQVKAAATPQRGVTELAQLLRDLPTTSAEAFAVDVDQLVQLGNLTATNLRTLLDCAGLDYLSDYATRENYIDRVLCARRHRIAHGGTEPVRWTDARDTATEVLRLCDLVNAQVQQAAVYREYLR